MLTLLNSTGLRWPNAVWAWEFLRRNQNYIEDYNRFREDGPKMFELNSGSQLIIGEARYEEARKWGLLFFADPSKRAEKAAVFWKPSVFPATIPVALRNPEREKERERLDNWDEADMVILSELCCNRYVFESINQSRHVVLAPRRYWLQLYCDSTHPLDDRALISFRIDGARHANKRIESVRQLLTLHRSSGRKLSSISRRRGTETLAQAITALDIRQRGGSYKDIARHIFGETLVNKSWSGGHSPLKQKARRALERGQHYRDGKYLELLS